MKRTTILVDESLLLELKHKAKSEKRSMSELIREALSEYLKEERKRQRLSFVGIGGSGRKGISESDEKILKEAIRKDA